MLYPVKIIENYFKKSNGVPRVPLSIKEAKNLVSNLSESELISEIQIIELRVDNQETIYQITGQTAQPSEVESDALNKLVNIKFDERGKGASIQMRLTRDTN